VQQQAQHLHPHRTFSFSEGILNSISLIRYKYITNLSSLKAIKFNNFHIILTNAQSPEKDQKRFYLNKNKLGNTLLQKKNSE